MNIPRSFPLQRFLRGPLGQFLIQLLVALQLFQGWPFWRLDAAQAPNSNSQPPNASSSAASINSSSQSSQSSSSGAGSTTEVGVFGPKDYIRDKGQPFVVTDTFAVAAPVGTFTLRITNGGLKSQYPRVSSAVVILNGVVVVGPSDFNKNVALIEKQVTLLPKDVLTVELFSEPGSGFTLQILGGQVNRAPVADAGADQTAVLLQTGQIVQLDGSRSSDADGDALTYRWSIRARPAGSQSAIADPIAVKPTLFIDKPGGYEIELIVNDGHADSSPDTVLITTINSAPAANAGSNQTARVTDTAMLDGSKSSDVDGDELTYRWSLLTRPALSNAQFADAAAVKPTFVVDAPGIYVAQLIVNDGRLDSTPATVTITTINSPPIANAGPDQSGLIGEMVTLDGSKSRDVDNDPLTYRWALIATPPGSQAALTNATSVNPTFVIDVHGDYVAQLIVNDGKVDSPADTVVISTINSKPVADAGPNQNKQTGEVVTLDGSASFDADHDPLTYRWSIASAPTDSQIALLDADKPPLIFTPDVPGLYIFQLIVNDGYEDSNPDTASVNVAQANRPPAITSTPVTTATVGLLYSYAVTATDPDPGDKLTFSLSFAPAGMTIDPTSGLIQWTPTSTQVGPQSVTVRVTDAGGLFAAQSFAITVIQPNRAPTITSTAVTTATATLPYSYQVTATDPDVGDVLTFSLPTAPSGMTINPTSGLISWTPTLVQVGQQNVTVRVTDNGGLFAEQSFTITVAQPNRPPILTSTPVTTATATQLYLYQVTATDPDVGDSLTFSLTSAPTGMTINAQTGLIQWTPTALQGGQQNVTVRVTDLGGLFAEQPFAINVLVNHAPQITSTPNFSQWTQLIPTGTPPTQRAYGGFNGYDLVNDRLILFGGSQQIAGAPHLNDVWVLTNATGASGLAEWIQLTPTGTPPPVRVEHSIAYDPTANRLIVHGGCGGNCLPILGDTWVLTNANGLGGTPEWIQLPSSGTRSGHVAGYDPVSNRMVVFGGHVTGFPGGDANDVSVLIDANGIGSPQWLALSPVGTPPPPRGEVASGVYDPLSNRLIVFGGLTTQNALLGDVWVLSNANGLGGAPTWTQLAPAGTAPTPRGEHSVVYDANSNRIVVFGGIVSVGTPYLFTQETWALIHANGIGGPPEWVKLETSGAVSQSSRQTAITTFGDKAAFLAATGATSATGPLPLLGYVSSAKVGAITISNTSGSSDPSVALGFGHFADASGNWTDWTQLLPGVDLAVGGFEDLNIILDAPTFSFGFDFAEHMATLSEEGSLCGGGSGCVDSTFTVSLLLGSSPVGSFSFNSPNDVASFVGVSSPAAFDRVEIRESRTQGGVENDYFGQFYIGGKALFANVPVARGFHSVGYAGASNRMVVALGRNDRETPTVFNDAWVLSNATGNCTAGQPCNYQVTASDPDVGDVLTYSLDTAPTGMTVDAGTGLISWTPTPEQIGDSNVTVRVTDNGGLFATQSFIITVAPVAVPNVVGLDPESAQALIGAADLNVGTTTNVGGAITLNFDTLPSAQGWTYFVVNNPATETEVFSVSGGTLFQNSLSTGFQGQGSNRYNYFTDISPRLPFTLSVRARVLEETGAINTNSFGFAFGPLTKTKAIEVGLGTRRIQDVSANVLSTQVDNTQFHDYRLEGSLGTGYPKNISWQLKNRGLGEREARECSV